MQGRYGFDKLYFFLSIISILLLFVGAIVLAPMIRLIILILAFIIVLFAINRVFSRNKYKRNKENLLYQKLSAKVSGFIKRIITRFRERKTHKYFKCPKCKATLRVPKGKGKIKISCPKCDETFIKST